MGKAARASSITGVAFGLVGFAVPIAFPQAPMWVGYGLLGVAAIILMVTLIWWFLTKEDQYAGLGPQNFGVHHHHYGSPVRDEIAAVSRREEVPATLPGVTVAPPPLRSGGNLAPLTVVATGTLFPLGLYVGNIIVSAGKLEDEAVLEIAVRTYNGTGLELRVAGVNGSIQVKGNGPSDEAADLPLPAFRPDQSLIPPHVEFLVVLEQRVPPNLTSAIRDWLADGLVQLRLGKLNIIMERTDVPESRARLPLWDGVSISRRDDIHSGRMFIITVTGTAIGSASVTGEGIALRGGAPDASES